MSIPALLSLLAAIFLLSPAQASNFGRLFFSSEERAQLEKTLKARQDENSHLEQSTISVNGVIMRSDGSRIVWLNGHVQKTESGGDAHKVSVSVSGKNKPVEIKVGQRVVLDNPENARFKDDNLK